MSTENIWETFDSLWKAVYTQGRRIEHLEARLSELESKLVQEGAVVYERVDGITATSTAKKKTREELETTFPSAKENEVERTTATTRACAGD